MRNALKGLIVASALSAVSIAAVQPAEAHVDTGVAVAAGILGLGVGAAIASDHSHYQRTEYYPAQYSQPAYGYNDGYQQAYGYDDNSYDARQQYWTQRHWQEERQRQWQRDRWERHHRHDGDDYYGN